MVAVDRAVHYAIDMIKTALCLLLLTPAVASAVICKSLGEDGEIAYTDVPVGECKQEVDLPDYSRYEPRPIDQQEARPSDASGTTIEFVRYESIAIVQPRTGGTERSNEGRVTVVIQLQPDLQPGHRVNLTLDGRPVTGSFDGVAIDLSGVDRGTHTLRASVADANGRILISTAPVTFTLRKTGLTDSNANPGPSVPPPQPEPGFPAPTGPADFSPPSSGGSFAPGADADFSPGGAANYTPPSSPGFAPGNSYTPNYSR